MLVGPGEVAFAANQLVPAFCRSMFAPATVGPFERHDERVIGRGEAMRAEIVPEKADAAEFLPDQLLFGGSEAVVELCPARKAGGQVNCPDVSGGDGIDIVVFNVVCLHRLAPGQVGREGDAHAAGRHLPMSSCVGAVLASGRFVCKTQDARCGFVTGGWCAASSTGFQAHSWTRPIGLRREGALQPAGCICCRCIIFRLPRARATKFLQIIVDGVPRWRGSATRPSSKTAANAAAVQFSDLRRRRATYLVACVKNWPACSSSVSWQSRDARIGKVFSLSKLSNLKFHLTGFDAVFYLLFFFYRHVLDQVFCQSASLPGWPDSPPELGHTQWGRWYLSIER